MHTPNRYREYSLAITLVLFFATVSFAQTPGEHSGEWERNRQEHFDALVKELHLSPQQEQQITIQRNKEKEQGKTSKQEMTAIRAQLSRELEKDSPNKEVLSSLVSRMKEIMGRRIEQRVERILAMKQILTPKQFKQLNDKKKEFRMPQRRQR